MLVKNFKIVGEKQFDIYVDDIERKKNEAIVKINEAAVCKADLRYYLGKRNKRILGLKYPMTLLHEAVGIITSINENDSLKKGDKVVLVPNLILRKCDSMCKYNVCRCKELGENYCPYAKFVSSNYNGFSREYINYPVKNLVKIPFDLEDNVAVFCELVSVACSIYRRVDIDESSIIAIFGDGILGYILCCLIKTIINCKVIIVGKHKEKMDIFPADYTMEYNEHKLASKYFNVAYECVGGQGMQSAVNNIMESIVPGGKIILTGVSESNIEVNSRKILEKGLSLYGATRSNIDDFKKAALLLNDAKFRKNISKLILEEREIRNIIDYYDVFESECKNKKLGKYVMKFKF